MPDVVLLSVIPSGNTDVVTRVGGPVFPADSMSSADQDSIQGNGTWLLPLEGVGGGGGAVAVSVNGTEIIADANDLDFRGAVAVQDAGSHVAAVAPSSQSFMFRPGSGFQGPVVWNNFTQLYAALNTARDLMGGDAVARGGSFEIVFCDVDGAVTIPAGVYDMSAVTFKDWRGIPGSLAITTVELADGVAINNLVSIVGLLIQNTAAASAAIFLGTTQTLNLLGTFISAIAAPIIRVIATTDDAVINVGDDSIIEGLASGNAAIEVLVGCQCVVNLNGAGSQLGVGAMTGGGNAEVNVRAAGSMGSFDTLSGLGSSSLALAEFTRWWPTDTVLSGNAPVGDTSPLALYDGDATLTLTLQNSTSNPGGRGKPILIKEALGNSAGVCTVQTFGGSGATIDGAATLELRGAYAWVVLVADDINNTWHVVGSSTTVGLHSFTFRPGSSTNGPAVFDDFTQLYAVLQAVRTASQNAGSFEIIIDDSLSSATVPAGTYDLSLCVLRGQKLSGSNTLVFDDGAVIEHCTQVTDLGLSFGSYVATNWPFVMHDGETFLIVRTSFNGQGCAAVADGSATLILDEQSAPGAGSIEVVAGAAISVTVVGNGASLGPDVLFGAGEAFIELSNPSGIFSQQQTNLLGTKTFIQNNKSRYWPSDNGQIKTADAEFQDFDQVMLCDGTQTFSVSLPDSAGGFATLYGNGRICIVKTIGTGGTVTVRSDTTTIDGAATFPMTQQDQCTAFLYDLANDEYRVLWNYFIAA